MAEITSDLAKKSRDHLETTRTISTRTTLLVHMVKVHIIQTWYTLVLYILKKIKTVVRIDKGGLISETGC